MKNSSKAILFIICSIIGLLILNSILDRSHSVSNKIIYSASEKKLIKEIKQTHNTNYLINKINTFKNGMNVELNTKTWKNPNDTKNLAYSIASLLKQNNVEDDYSILVHQSSFKIYKLVKSDTLVIIENYYKKNKKKYKAEILEENNKWKTVDEIEIRGQKIYHGLHADTVFKVLTKSDQIKESDIRKDGSGNLIVTHHWKVDNRKLDITFERWFGMYRVKKIRVLNERESNSKSTITSESNKVKVTAAPNKPKQKKYRSSKWEIDYFVDDFGDKTTTPYLTNKYRILGTFSNVATQNSALGVYFIISDSLHISFKLFEYNRSNPVKKYSYEKYDYLIKVKTEAGTKYSWYAGNIGDRIRLNSTSSTDLHNLFRKHNTLKFHIKEIDSQTKYSFDVDATGYTSTHNKMMDLFR